MDVVPGTGCPESLKRLQEDVLPETLLGHIDLSGAQAKNGDSEEE